MDGTVSAGNRDKTITHVIIKMSLLLLLLLLLLYLEIKKYSAVGSVLELTRSRSCGLERSTARAQFPGTNSVLVPFHVFKACSFSFVHSSVFLYAILYCAVVMF